MWGQPRCEMASTGGTLDSQSAVGRNTKAPYLASSTSTMEWISIFPNWHTTMTTYIYDRQVQDFYGKGKFWHQVKLIYRQQNQSVFVTTLSRTLFKSYFHDFCPKYSDFLSWCRIGVEDDRQGHFCAHDATLSYQLLTQPQILHLTTPPPNPRA